MDQLKSSSNLVDKNSPFYLTSRVSKNTFEVNASDLKTEHSAYQLKSPKGLSQYTKSSSKTKKPDPEPSKKRRNSRRRSTTQDISYKVFDDVYRQKNNEYALNRAKLEDLEDTIEEHGHIVAFPRINIEIKAKNRLALKPEVKLDKKAKQISKKSLSLGEEPVFEFFDCEDDQDAIQKFEWYLDNVSAKNDNAQQCIWWLGTEPLNGKRKQEYINDPQLLMEKIDQLYREIASYRKVGARLYGDGDDEFAEIEDLLDDINFAESIMSTLTEENEEEESVIQSKMSLKIERINKHVEIRTESADDDHLFVDNGIKKLEETLVLGGNDHDRNSNMSKSSSRASIASEVGFYDRTYGSQNYASQEFASKNYDTRTYGSRSADPRETKTSADPRETKMSARMNSTFSNGARASTFSRRRESTLTTNGNIQLCSGSARMTLTAMRIPPKPEETEQVTYFGKLHNRYSITEFQKSVQNNFLPNPILDRMSIISNVVSPGQSRLGRSGISKSTATGRSGISDATYGCFAFFNLQWIKLKMKMINFTRIPEMKWAQKKFRDGLEKQNSNLDLLMHNSLKSKMAEKLGGDSLEQAFSSKMAGDLGYSNAKNSNLRTLLGSIISGNFVLHPYSGIRFTWDILTILILLVMMFVIPFEAAFIKEEANGGLLNMINMISDIWFILDVWINFHTGYIDDDNLQIVLKLPKVRKKYLRGWFGIDLLASIPFPALAKVLIWIYISFRDLQIGESLMMGRLMNDRSVSIHSLTQSLDTLKFFRFTKILTLIKLLRMGRLIRYMRMWEEAVNLEYNLINDLLAIFLLVMGAFFIVHISACLMWFSALQSGFPDNSWVKLDAPFIGKDLEELWYNTQTLQPSLWDNLQDNGYAYSTNFFFIYPYRMLTANWFSQNSFSEIYLWSFFKSASQMICVGFGYQRFPLNIYDCICTFFTLWISAFYFLILVGHISTFIQQLNVQKNNYTAKIQDIDGYCRFQKLPADLTQKIQQYLVHRYQGKFFNEKEIMSELNPILLREVIRYTFLPLVLQCPYFLGTSDAFINEVGEAVIFEQYIPGQVISRIGNLGTRFYIIDKGSVLTVGTSGKVYQVNRDGEFFGELALLGLYNYRRACDVLAIKPVRLYYLELSAFENLAKRFPVDVKIFKARLLLHAVKLCKLDLTRAGEENKEYKLHRSNSKTSKSSSFKEDAISSYLYNASKGKTVSKAIQQSKMQRYREGKSALAGESMGVSSGLMKSGLSR